MTTNARSKKGSFGLYNKTLLFAIAAFSFLFVVLFAYVPLFGWTMAFFYFKPGFNIFQCDFMGFHYFKQAFTHLDFLDVMRNTLVMSLLGLLTTPIPMAIAILLSEMKNKRFRSAVQTMTTLPYFISWVLVFSMSFAFFSPSDGLINHIILAFNPNAQTLDLMGNADATWFFQTALGIWKGVGYSAIIYLAAIAGIDPELYDAANVDGAKRFQSIWHITVPNLIPTFLALFLLGVGSILSNGFDQYYLFQNNLNKDTIQVLDLFQYNVTMKSATPGGNYPLSTAIAMSKTIVSIILLFLANFLSKRLRGNSII
jgi:putative aldouronate transport system permease protein